MDDTGGSYLKMPVVVTKGPGHYRRNGYSKLWRLSQLSPCTRALLVHNKTVANLKRGLEQRVFYCPTDSGLKPPPQPVPDAFNRLQCFADAVVGAVPLTTPWTPEQFVESYTGRKRSIYEKAMLSLRVLAIRRQDGFVTGAFVKMEKAKLGSVPRIISPRTPRYNVEVGRYTRPIEHKVYKAIAIAYNPVDPVPVVMKGYNAVERGNLFHKVWRTFNHPVALMSDASRFDQHMSVPALQWEHSVYNRIYKDDHLKMLLSWQLGGKCLGLASDGKVKYSVRGTRASGDMNTALGNCLVMAGMIFAYCAHAGIGKHHVFNDGDDAVIICERDDLARFAGLKDWFREMGFSMKLEDPVYELEGIEFCQSHPVWDGVGYRMVRKHGVAMTKDCLSIKPLNGKKVFDAWRSSVSDCGKALTTGIPCQYAFYEAFGRGAERAKRMVNEPTLDTGMARLAKGLVAKQRDITDMSRFSYYLAFGVLPEEQIALEGVYRTITPSFSAPEPQGVYHHPAPQLSL